VTHEIVLEADGAAVLRAPDGRLSFGERGARFAVRLNGYEPHGVRADGRLFVAGRMPPTAASVIVIDAAGDEYPATIKDGVWLATPGTADYDSLVRYLDNNNQLVSTLPPGPRAHVRDAHEPCPACGHVAWVMYDEDGARIIACERCGLTLGGTAAVGPLPAEVGTEPPRKRRAPRKPRRTAAYEREMAEMLAGADFPRYGPPGELPVLRKSSGDEDRLLSVEIDYDAVTVICAVEHDRGLRRHLEAFLARDRDDAPASMAAGMIRWRTAYYTARREVATTPASTHREFVVDGAAARFEFLATGAGWGAHRQHDGVAVTILARGVDPASVSLVTAAGRTPSRRAGRLAATRRCCP
jgi:hypothetical protein